MNVLDDFTQPPELAERALRRTAMGKRQREIGERRNNQSRIVSELRQAYEGATEEYKELLRGSVLGTRSDTEAEDARQRRDQFKEQLEAETEMLDALQQAVVEISEQMTADYNAMEMEKRRIIREFCDRHMEAVCKAFDEAAANYAALRYLAGRLDNAAYELADRIHVIQNTKIKEMKAAARRLDALPDPQAAAA